MSQTPVALNPERGHILLLRVDRIGVADEQDRGDPFGPPPGDQVIAEALPPVALHDEAYGLELARHECSDLVDPRLVGGSALDVDQTLEQSKGLPCLI